MQNPFKRVITPLLLRVDFLDHYWSISPKAARCWLGGAVVADLVVQKIAGLPNMFTVLASLLTLVIFWSLPPRLSGAVGGLYIGQALISLPVVVGAQLAGGAYLANAAGVAWSVWCMVALAKLVLTYVRTPKGQMP